MVYGSATVFPTPEGAADEPTAGLHLRFQKVASECFADGAHEQFRFPYTIVRPLNCVGSVASGRT